MTGDPITLVTGATGFVGSRLELEHSQFAWCSDSTVAALIHPDTAVYPRTFALIVIRDAIVRLLA